VFTVDAFKYGSIKGCSAYFLSHFHYDHYIGLNKHWNHGPIYCSPSTARLVVLKLRVDPQYIRSLPLGWEHPSTVEGVEVILLDANHCPGAVVFLMRIGQSGPANEYILHTGDFRASGVMQCHPQLSQLRVKCLYLDTTYCDPKHTFPPQQLVLDWVAELARHGQRANQRTLFLVGSYTIGKEKVYLEIARALGCKIYAETERFRTLQCLDWPELSSRITKDPSATPLHVVPMNRLNAKALAEYLDKYKTSFSALLAFRPTGWTFSDKIGDDLRSIRPQKHGKVRICSTFP